MQKPDFDLIFDILTLFCIHFATCVVNCIKYPDIEWGNLILWSEQADIVHWLWLLLSCDALTLVTFADNLIKYNDNINNNPAQSVLCVIICSRLVILVYHGENYIFTIIALLYWLPFASPPWNLFTNVLLSLCLMVTEHLLAED